MKNRPIICLIIALFYTHAIWADDETDLPKQHEAHFVDKTGQQYSYFDAPDGVGTIEIHAPKTHELVFREKNLQQEACSGVGGPSDSPFTVTPRDSDGEEYVLFCGTDQWHFHTIMFLEQGYFKLRSLYGDIKIIWHPEFKSFQSVIYFEPGSEYRDNVVAELYEFGDTSITSIELLNYRPQPVFNSHAYPFYTHAFIEDRLEYIHNPSNPDRIGVITIFADLLATNTPSFICAGLKRFPFKKMKTAQLQKMVGVLESFGFPSFEFSICKSLK